MRKRFFVEGLVAGAAAAFFYDPQKGRTRREEFTRQLWDTLHAVSQAAADTVDLAKREVTDRAEALSDEAQTLLHPDAKPRRRKKAERVSLADDFFEDRWQPETRMIAGASGLLLMANCRLRRSLSSRLWGLVGFGLLARAVTNQRIRELLGLEALLADEDEESGSATGEAKAPSARETSKTTKARPASK